MSWRRVIRFAPLLIPLVRILRRRSTRQTGPSVWQQANANADVSSASKPSPSDPD